MDKFVNSTRNCDNRDVFAELPDNSVDLILTDPPYKDYQSNRPVAHDKIKLIKESNFDLPFFIEQSARVLKPGRHFYCWCDHISFPGIVAAIGEQATVARAAKRPHYMVYKNCLIWVKSNHGSGDLKGDWAPQHEFIIYGYKAPSRRPYFGKRSSNVFFNPTDQPGVVELIKKVSNYHFNHSNSKPVEILKRIIEYSTLPGELVFDPYAGSMSTGEACILTARDYLLVELDEEFYQEGLQRLKNVAK